MEEADSILLLTLSRAGCAVPDSATTLAEVLHGDALVPMCASCLRAIHPDDPAPPPTALPPETSGRFRAGNDLAARLHALGYTRDLGFHQFLYPSEPDARAILKFLLDKMPRASDADAAAQGGVENDGSVRGGRALTAADRAMAAVGASLRRGRDQEIGKAEGIGAGRGGAGLARLVQRRTGLAAVVAAATKNALCVGGVSRPFWTTPLAAPTRRPRAPAPAGSDCLSIAYPPTPPAAFTSGAPPGYLPPSLLEYTAASVAEARMKADAQLARLATAHGRSGISHGAGGLSRRGREFLFDTSGNPITPEDLARLVAAGYVGAATDASADAAARAAISAPPRRTRGVGAMGIGAGGSTTAAGAETGCGKGGGGEVANSTNAGGGNGDFDAGAAADIRNLAAAAAAAAAANTDTVEGRVKARETELEDLRQRLRQSVGAVGAAEVAAAEATRAGVGAAEDTAREKDRTKGLEAEYLLRKQTTGLVLGSERTTAESEAELGKALAAAELRMEALRAEWDTARAPLEGELAAHAAAADARRGTAKRQLAAVQTFRAQTRTLAAEARAKEDEQRALVAEYEAAPKSVQRPNFVRRISEIVKNVKKQEGEISKIVHDTREIQRDIGGAHEAMGRAYALVDDTLFRDAVGGSPACKEAYRHLSAVHSGFAELTSKVEEAGRCGRAQRDLERRLEDLRAHPVDLERVATDVEAVRTEIHKLEQQLAMVAATGGAGEGAS